MRFDDHPTWRMLETGMKSLRVVRDNADTNNVRMIAETAISSLYSLQLELENILIDLEDSDEQ